MDKYVSFDNLLQAINSFASSEGYVVVNRRTKVSEKRVLRKAILLCDWNKEYHSENWSIKEISSWKTDCVFNAFLVL